MKKILYTALGIFLAFVVIIILIISYANYSEGTRAGVVVKMSKRGYIFKTFEGQLNVGGLSSDASGVIPSVWDFSVKRNKEDVIQKLEEAHMSGARVKLYYKEKFYKFPWIADTKYYVFKVETITNQTSAQ